MSESRGELVSWTAVGEGVDLLTSDDRRHFAQLVHLALGPEQVEQVEATVKMLEIPGIDLVHSDTQFVTMLTVISEEEDEDGNQVMHEERWRSLFAPQDPETVACIAAIILGYELDAEMDAALSVRIQKFNEEQRQARVEASRRAEGPEES